MRAVKYQDTSDNPSGLTRTVSFTVNDGTANSNTVTRNIAVTPVNDPSVLAAIEGTALAYTENQAATAITATVTTSDLDNTNLASATIQITGNYVNGEDVLSFTNTGSITGTWTAATGTLTLTGSDTVANYQAALRAVKYQNTSDNPSGLTRTVSFTVNDGTANSNTVTRNIAVTPVNDPSVLAAIEGTALAYTENQVATAITATVTASDLDNTNLASATIQITGNYSNGEDVLSFTNTGSITGTWTAATGTLTLSGSDTVANYQAALRAVKYQNTSDNPSGLTRTVSFTVNDGTANSNTVTRNIAVTPVNDPSVLAAIEGTALAYTENQAATAITATVTTSDLDNTNLASATIQITSNYVNGEDVLSFTNTGSITGTWTAATGTLTLTGSDTVANYQAALRAVKYQNTSDNPSGLTRTVSFTVNDGTANSNTVTRNIAVTPVNDAPVITSNGGGDSASLNIAENATAVTTVTSTDVDGGTPVYSLAGGADAAKFTINSSTGALSFLAAPDYESPTDVGGNNVYDVIVQVSDGAGGTDTQALAVTVTAVNDNNPVITSNGGGATASVNVAENTTAVTTVTATDADVPSQTLAYSIVGGADAALFTIDSGSGALSFVSGRNRESHTDADSNGVYEVTVQASDGTLSDTQAISVTITDVDEFDVGAVADSNAAANAVNENAANGTAVGITASASDADATTNAITYTLDDNAGGRFTIHATTGVVTVAGAIDRETAASYNITVRATSADTSYSTQTFTIAINDVDEFDVGAVTDSNAAANAVNENAVNGTTVGITAAASDADATTNAITYSLTDSAGGRFTIHASTGVVTVAGAIDRETAASPTTSRSGPRPPIPATRRRPSRSRSTTWTSSTSAPSPTPTPPPMRSTRTRSTARRSGSRPRPATRTPPPTRSPTSLDDNAGGRFAIHASTGVVTVAGAIDRETAASYNITVRATSADTSYSTQTFTIAVNDVDEFDVGAVTDSNAAANAVNENAVNGTTVGITAAASDADATTNAITYSLTDSAGGRFTIHASTGVVTVAGAIDRETAASYNITVQATSADTSYSTQTFTIAINDVDEFDVGAVSDADATVNAVNENAVNGTTVGITASASDADATTNAITYTLDDNAGGRFAIHASTGVVTVAGAIDRETAASYNITVRATSADTSYSTQTFTIAVNDVDEFDVGAVTDSNAAANTVAENAGVGTDGRPDRPGQRRGCHGHDHVQPGRQRGRPVRDPRHDRRGHGQRRSRLRNLHQSLGHDPGHQFGRLVLHPELHDPGHGRQRVGRERDQRHGRSRRLRAGKRRQRHGRGSDGLRQRSRRRRFGQLLAGR